LEEWQSLQEHWRNISSPSGISLQGRSSAGATVGMIPHMVPDPKAALEKLREDGMTKIEGTMVKAGFRPFRYRPIGEAEWRSGWYHPTLQPDPKAE
jgi:hypothetical protein